MERLDWHDEAEGLISSQNVFGWWCVRILSMEENVPWFT